MTFTRQQLADAVLMVNHIPAAEKWPNGELITDRLEAAATQLIADGEAVEAEFEKCCKDVCSGCLQNIPVSRVRSGWWHPRTDCAANNIRERRYREQETKP